MATTLYIHLHRRIHATCWQPGTELSCKGKLCACKRECEDCSVIKCSPSLTCASMMIQSPFCKGWLSQVQEATHHASVLFRSLQTQFRDMWGGL